MKESKSPKLTAEQHAATQQWFLENTERELCWDLAGKFARRSARATRNDSELADIRLRYTAIAEEFHCTAFSEPLTAAKEKRFIKDLLRAENSGKSARKVLADYFAATTPKQSVPSLSAWLWSRYQTDQDTKSLVAKIERCVAEHLSRLNPSPSLFERRFEDSLLQLLACEWLRDRKSLASFLIAMFQRWRKLGEPMSTWRRRMVIAQMSTVFGHNRKQHQDHLETIGALKPNEAAVASEAASKTISKHQKSVNDLIGQDLSRISKSRRGPD